METIAVRKGVACPRFYPLELVFFKAPAGEEAGPARIPAYRYATVLNFPSDGLPEAMTNGNQKRHKVRTGSGSDRARV